MFVILVTYSSDYQKSRAQEFDKTIVDEFFNPYKMRSTCFVNKQAFDWEGLKAGCYPHLIA